jgi:hypothetical protein
MGRQPRRELGIVFLMQAVAELEAIPPEDRSSDRTMATSLVKQALADARANIAYAYPRASSRPLVPPLRPALTPTRLANAESAMQAALEQLSSAGNGPNEVLLKRSIDAIRQALDTLGLAAPEIRRARP